MNRIIQFLLIVLLLSPATLKAQQETFTKVFYDPAGMTEMYAAMATADNHFLIAGHRDYQPLVLKINQQGEVVWQRTFGLDQSWFQAAALAGDGSYLLAGFAESPIDGTSDIFCVRMTPEGDTLWCRAVHLGDYEKAMAITETDDHQIMVTGYSKMNWTAVENIALVRLTASGDLLWGRTINSGSNSNIGRGICPAAGGGCYLTGAIKSTSPYNEALFLAKFTDNAAMTWIKKASGTAMQSEGLDVQRTPAGLVWLAYSNYTSVLAVSDTAGNLLWGNKVGMGTATNSWYPSPKLSKTADGGYLVVNYAPMSPGNVSRTDSLGNIQWANQLTLISMAALETEGGGALLIGNGPIVGVNMSPTDHPQIGLIRTDSLGHSQDCVFPDFYLTEAFTTSFATPPTVVTPGGMLHSIAPAISSASDLQVAESCIAVTGSIAENRGDNITLSLFPNPADKAIQVSLSHPSPGRVEMVQIINLMGAVVVNRAVDAALPMEVATGELPEGIYQLRAWINGRAYSAPLVIAR